MPILFITYLFTLSTLTKLNDDQIKEPVEYSRQLEAEVQAKACRVPQRIIAPLFASLNHLNTVRDLAVTEDRGQPQFGVKAGEARPANADLSRLDCNDQVKNSYITGTGHFLDTYVVCSLKGTVIL